MFTKHLAFDTYIFTVCYIFKRYILPCRYFKVGKDRRLSWSGLWVLLLLISADILNTSVSILNCPSLSDSDGKKKLVRTYIHIYVYMSLRMYILFSLLYRFNKQVYCMYINYIKDKLFVLIIII